MRSFSTRLGLIATTAVLAVSGVAWAADVIQADTATPGTTTFAVEDAGTVTVNLEGGAIELIDLTAADGWAASIDRETPTEIEIDFISASRRLRFNAEVEDGQIRTRLEERTTVGVTSSTSTTSTTTGPSTPATATGSESTPSGDEIFDVLGAGTVTLRIDGSTLILVDASPAEGWTASIDSQTALELEIDFRSGVNRIRFNGELEDGRIRPRIEVRDGAAPDGTPADGASSGAPSGTETFDIPGVGSVTVAISTNGLSLLTVTPSGEWTVEVEDADGNRIRVHFHRGESEVEFEARWDDGRFRYEIDQDLED
jgi:hypothetical protein